MKLILMILSLIVGSAMTISIIAVSLTVFAAAFPLFVGFMVIGTIMMLIGDDKLLGN